MADEQQTLPPMIDESEGSVEERESDNPLQDSEEVDDHTDDEEEEAEDEDQEDQDDPLDDLPMGNVQEEDEEEASEPFHAPQPVVAQTSPSRLSPEKTPNNKSPPPLPSSEMKAYGRSETSGVSLYNPKIQKHIIKNYRGHAFPTEKFYCIFPGNGYYILKAALSQKAGWREVPKDLAFSGKCNFIWRPTNFNYKMYCQIDSLNHQQVFAQDHTNSLAPQKNIESFLSQMGKPGGNQVHSRELVVNHLENNREITTKTGLIRSLKAYYKDNIQAIEKGYQVFDTTPTSFVVSSNLDTYEYHQFLKRFQDLKKNEGESVKEKMPPKQCKLNMWLVKPANENQGKGIRIFNELDQIIRFLESSLDYSYWVIQKYLERPLLYKGRKFDIRVWAVALSNQDFYFCDSGYLRTSSQEFSNSMSDEYVHLTNNVLQMRDEKNYGKHEQGNTLSFKDFENYLRQEYPELNLDFEKDFLARMKDMALDTYLSCKNTINPSKRRNCFEFFGYDFMIDEDFRLWLIEVNTNPYVGIHNQKMTNVLPEMFDGLFKITLDPVFEDVSQEQLDSQIGNSCWDLLYSRTRGVNKRRPITAGMYPIKELQLQRDLQYSSKKKYYKYKRKEFESPWTDEQKKQREYLSERRKRLQQIGENVNGKLRKKEIQLVKQQPDLAQQEIQDASLIKQRKEQLSALKAEPLEAGDYDGIGKESALSKSPDYSARGQARSANLLRTVSRSSLTKQMKQKNQPNFIPQPKLNMSRLKNTGSAHKRESQLEASEPRQNRLSLISESRSAFDEGHASMRKSKSTQVLKLPHIGQTMSKAGSQQNSDDDSMEDTMEGRKQSMPSEGFVQCMRPERTIVAQVKNLDNRSKFYKQKTLEIMNRIVSTMSSWELFSEDQLQDANCALKMLQQTLIYNPEDQKPIVRALIRLIGSNEVPINIRYQIALNVFLMFKNKVFLRVFIQDSVEAHITLLPLYQLLQESCQAEEPTPSMEDLFFECVNILSLIMALNSGRYHIPGETAEKYRLRQKALDSGLLAIVVHVMCQTKSESLRGFIYEEFFEKVEESDFDYHFRNNHSHYAMVSDFITEASEKQLIDSTCYDRKRKLNEHRVLQERFQQKLKQREQEREKKAQEEAAEALKEKRRIAEEKMNIRIKELQKIQNENLKKEQEEKELRDKLTEERRQVMQEEQRRKQEQRKKQMQKMQEKREREEREMLVEMERRNRDREIAKKIALEKWHQQKREEQKRRRVIERVRVKADKYSIRRKHRHDDDSFQPNEKFREYEAWKLYKKRAAVSQFQQAYGAKATIKLTPTEAQHFADQIIRETIEGVKSLSKSGKYSKLLDQYNANQKQIDTYLLSIAKNGQRKDPLPRINNSRDELTEAEQAELDQQELLLFRNQEYLNQLDTSSNEASQPRSRHPVVSPISMHEQVNLPSANESTLSQPDSGRLHHIERTLGEGSQDYSEKHFIEETKKPRKKKGRKGAMKRATLGLGGGPILVNEHMIRDRTESDEQKQFVSSLPDIKHQQPHSTQSSGLPTTEQPTPNQQGVVDIGREQGLLPTSITIINNDYSQQNYNNFYFSDASKKLAKQAAAANKKKPTSRNLPDSMRFDESLARKIIFGKDLPGLPNSQLRLSANHKVGADTYNGLLKSSKSPQIKDLVNQHKMIQNIVKESQGITDKARGNLVIKVNNGSRQDEYSNPRNLSLEPHRTEIVSPSIRTHKAGMTSKKPVKHINQSIDTLEPNKPLPEVADPDSLHTVKRGSAGTGQSTKNLGTSDSKAMTNDLEDELQRRALKITRKNNKRQNTFSMYKEPLFGNSEHQHSRNHVQKTTGLQSSTKIITESSQRDETLERHKSLVASPLKGDYAAGSGSSTPLARIQQVSKADSLLHRKINEAASQHQSKRGKSQASHGQGALPAEVKTANNASSLYKNVAQALQSSIEQTIGPSALRNMKSPSSTSEVRDLKKSGQNFKRKASPPQTGWVDHQEQFKQMIKKSEEMSTYNQALLQQQHLERGRFSLKDTSKYQSILDKSPSNYTNMFDSFPLADIKKLVGHSNLENLLQERALGKKKGSVTAESKQSEDPKLKSSEVKQRSRTSTITPNNGTQANSHKKGETLIRVKNSNPGQGKYVANLVSTQSKQVVDSNQFLDLIIKDITKAGGGIPTLPRKSVGGGTQIQLPQTVGRNGIPSTTSDNRSKAASGKNIKKQMNLFQHFASPPPGSQQPSN